MIDLFDPDPNGRTAAMNGECGDGAHGGADTGAS